MNSLHCPLNMSYNSCFEILWFESNSILNWFFTLLSSPYFWKCVYLSYFGLYEAKGWIIVRAILTPGSQWGDCLYDWWLKFFSFYALNYYPHGDSLCYTITSCYVRNYLCPLLMPLRLILYILTLLSTFSMLFSRTSPLVLVIPRSRPSQHGPPPDFSSEFFLLVIATTISSLLVVCICLSSVILQGFMGYGSGTKSLGLE